MAEILERRRCPGKIERKLSHLMQQGPHPPSYREMLVLAEGNSKGEAKKGRLVWSCEKDDTREQFLLAVVEEREPQGKPSLRDGKTTKARREDSLSERET